MWGAGDSGGEGAASSPAAGRASSGARILQQDGRRTSSAARRVVAAGTRVAARGVPSGGEGSRRRSPNARRPRRAGRVRRREAGRGWCAPGRHSTTPQRGRLEFGHAAGRNRTESVIDRRRAPSLGRHHVSGRRVGRRRTMTPLARSAPASPEGLSRTAAEQGMMGHLYRSSDAMLSSKPSRSPIKNIERMSLRPTRHTLPGHAPATVRSVAPRQQQPRQPRKEVLWRRCLLHTKGCWPENAYR